MTTVKLYYMPYKSCEPKPRLKKIAEWLAYPQDIEDVSWAFIRNMMHFSEYFKVVLTFDNGEQREYIKRVRGCYTGSARWEPVLHD